MLCPFRCLRLYSPYYGQYYYKSYEPNPVSPPIPSVLKTALRLRFGFFFPQSLAETFRQAVCFWAKESLYCADGTPAAFASATR